MAQTGSGLTLRAGAIGLREVLFQSITHMAPGVGVAFAIIVGATFAGGALPLSVLLAIIGCALTALSLGQLSRHFPAAGSFYTYAANSLHPAVGFLAGWMYAFGEMTGFPLCIILLGIIVPDALSTEESKDPRRLIGRAAVLSAILIGFYYAMITYGATVFFGPTKMANFPSFGGGNPYQQLARNVWGTGWIFIFLALVNSSVACSNAVNNAVTRTVFALGRIRVLPRALGSVHPRWRSPHVAVITVFVISVSTWLWLGFQYDPFTAFAILGTAITLVAVAIYILINISCFAYYVRFRRNEFNVVKHLIVPVLGIALFVPAFLTAAGITVFKFVSPLPKPLSYVGPALGVWLVIGIIYLVYLYRRAPERIADTKRVFVEEPPVEAIASIEG